MNRLSNPERGCVKLSTVEVGIAQPVTSCLDSAQPEEPCDGQWFLVEAVDEDGDHLGVGAGRRQEGAQHPVQVL